MGGFLDTHLFLFANQGFLGARERSEMFYNAAIY